jgi:RNA polymerase-associated protein
MLTLYDADRCPFCARVRIVLAEKDVEYENVQIDLADRPAWLYEKNPLGKVPVLEDGAFVLPESPVIMEYLEERYPEPALLPADPAERALARVWLERFDSLLGDDYYAARRGHEGGRERLDDRIAALDAALDATPYIAGATYTLADIAYVPWILRARELLGVDLDGRSALLAWLDRLLARPAVAAELDVVAALPR